MRIRLFQIDAFTDKVFCGNPAAVCVLEEWIIKEKMQKIAYENNLAETAFVVKNKNKFEIRWFTPLIEVDLCGHATLAAAYVMYKYYNYKSEKIHFYSHKSGELPVTKEGDFLTLNFPTDVYKQVETPQVLVQAFGVKPIESYRGKTDYLLIYSEQNQIVEFNPDMRLIEKVGGRGVIVSAPGEATDFVSRFFAPQAGINEDPVTGSAHTTLTPVWSEKLGKKVLTAKQLSKRQGDLRCEYLGERVKITGTAVTYLEGEIDV